MKTFKFIYETRDRGCLCGPRKPHTCKATVREEMINAASNMDAFWFFNNRMRDATKKHKFVVTRLIDSSEVNEAQYEVVK